MNNSNIYNGLGALRPKIDLRDYKMSIGEQTFPKAFQLEAPHEIKNQGNVSSCVANMASYLKEKLYKKVSGVYKRFSVGYIYGNKPNSNMLGMYLRDAFKLLNDQGDVLNSDFNYDLEVPEIQEELQKAGNNRLNTLAAEHKIKTYFSVNGENQIKAALQEYGYVGIGVPWYSDNTLEQVSNSDETLTILHKGLDYDGNHAITIYGWNETGWLIANSWGVEWGNSGCATLPYDYPIDESWCATENPNENIVKPVKNSMYSFVLKFINIIINLYMKIIKRN